MNNDNYYNLAIITENCYQARNCSVNRSVDALAVKRTSKFLTGKCLITKVNAECFKKSKMIFQL